MRGTNKRSVKPFEIWHNVNDQIHYLFSGKTSYVLKEKVQLWVAAGVHCNLKQRHEDVLQHLLEVTQLFLCVVDITMKRE